MDKITTSMIPAWITNPTKLLKALAYSEYYNDSFLHTTTHSDPTIFRKYITQFLYWKRRLSPSLTPRTIIFTLLGADGLDASNVIDVILELSKVCNITGAFEFYQAANPNFIGISFQQDIDYETFIQHFTYYKEYIVAYVLPVSSQTRAFSMLWLPPLFNIKRVHTLLSKYCKHTSMHPGTIKIAPGKFLQTSTIRGTLTIRDDCNFEDIPHLIPLPAPHIGHALLIITGREPYCLKCLNQGHLRKDCPVTKCQHCNFFHDVNILCDNLSYAQKVANSSSIGAQYCWPDDVAGEEETLAPPNSDNNIALSPPTHPLLNNESTNISATSTISNNHPDSSPAQHNLPLSISSTPSSLSNQHSSNCDHTSHSTCPNLISNKNTAGTEIISKPKPSCSTPTLLNNNLQPFDSTAPANTGADMGQQPPNKNIEATPFSTALVTYSRTINTSKVRITTKPDSIRDSLRSTQITYTPFQQALCDNNNQDMLPIVGEQLPTLFQDSATNYYDSDSNSSVELHMFVDPPEATNTDSTSRKRKVSPSDPENSPSTSLPSTSEHDILVSSIRCSIDSSTIPESTPIPHSSCSTLVTHHTSAYNSEHREQAAQLFSLTSDQTAFLEELCPKGIITTEILKCLKILSNHGINYAQIIASPYILEMHSAALKRKIKFLLRRLGTFNINDIVNASRIEDKLDYGNGNVTPSGAFYDT